MSTRKEKNCIDFSMKSYFIIRTIVLVIPRACEQNLVTNW